MRILPHVLIWEWCRTHDFPLVEPDVGPPHLRDDPALVHRSRLVFAPRGPAGHESVVASAVLAALGRWDGCLLWITGWGAWPSSEDWPRYYALRGRHGVRTSIDDAPGHLVGPEEMGELEDLLRQVMENGWDAVLLSSRDGRPLPVRIRISHDGWVRVDAAEPRRLSVPGLDPEPA